MKFTKMQAFGNDYVYVDAIHQELPPLSRLARFVSDRHFAIGSDGLVLICPSERADFRMRMFNPDGTEGEMCGNALRSVGKFVYDHALTNKKQLTIETLGGMKSLTLTTETRLPTDGEKSIKCAMAEFVSNIRADIGRPVMDTAHIPVNSGKSVFLNEPVEILDRRFLFTAVSWGNPHVVTFLNDEELDGFDVETYGRAIEHHTKLFPNKTNVTFATVRSRDTLRIREWERGTGETIGCGTGCCTALVAAHLLGMCDRAATVHQIGGPLFVEWEQGTDCMYMTGPSHNVFESEIDVRHLMD